MSSERSTVSSDSSSPAPAIAVILARAGSKGVPGKNTAIVAGRPCIEWTILDALRSVMVSDVVVSTDCPRVRAVAEAHHLFVAERPCDLATDSATVDAAARHAVLEFEQRARSHRLSPDAPIVILYANVPARPANLIDEAVRTLLRTRSESVQSYTPVGKHHPWWTCTVNDRGAVRPFDGVHGDGLFHGVYRRQDLPPAHIPDGGVMAVTRRALMLELPDVPRGPHAFLGPARSRSGVITPEGSVVDIDSPLDLIVADAVLRARECNNEHHALAARAEALR